MIFNINEELSNMKNIKGVISSIMEDIQLKTIEYENIIDELKDGIVYNKCKLDLIRDKEINVKLKDLVDEISWLSGIDTSIIFYSLKFHMFFSDMNNLYSFIDNIKFNDISYIINNVKFELKSGLMNDNNGNNGFEYFKFLSFDLGEVQQDGTKMIEKCSMDVKPFGDDRISVNFVVNEKLDDVILKFKLVELENKDSISWYPADLISMAIINCSSREYNLQVDKVRKKIK